MIKYIPGTDLWLFPDLARSMFKDRAAQFSERLNWKVNVDNNGYERDQYDALNPIYVILEDDSGQHAGSMRLLPTIGRTMINDCFAATLQDGPIHDAKTWECTRFCLSPSAGARTAEKAFASAGRLMRELNINSLIAVFDQHMFRKYRLSGVTPELLGKGNFSCGPIFSGRWQFNQAKLNDLMRRGRLDPLECELALANSPFYRGNEPLSA